MVLSYMFIRPTPYYSAVTGSRELLALSLVVCIIEQFFVCFLAAHPAVKNAGTQDPRYAQNQMASLQVQSVVTLIVDHCVCRCLGKMLTHAGTAIQCTARDAYAELTNLSSFPGRRVSLGPHWQACLLPLLAELPWHF